MLVDRKLKQYFKGQGSIDYAFMIALGLLFILIAFAFIIEDYERSRKTATEYAENLSIKSQAIISKSQLENFGFWNDNFTISLGSPYIIKIYNEGVLVYIVNYENTTFRDDIYEWNNVNGLSFFEIYEKCLNGNTTACKFLITLKEGIWEKQ